MPGEQIVSPVYYSFHFKAHFPHYWLYTADPFSSILTKNCSGLGSHVKQHRTDTLHMDVKGLLLALLTTYPLPQYDISPHIQNLRIS